jgi:hypothetical protein
MRSAPKRARKILAPLPFLKGEQIFITEIDELEAPKKGNTGGGSLKR